MISVFEWGILRGTKPYLECEPSQKEKKRKKKALLKLILFSDVFW